MKYVTAIVLAAGQGLRFKSRITKPLVEINSKPVIIYSLDTLSSHAYIRDIILVANSKNLKGINSRIRQYHIGKIRAVVLGGPLRQDSVLSGLKAMNPKTELVLIHDGARPFVAKDTITSVIKEAKRSQAAIVGVPVKATIKKIETKRLKCGPRFVVEKTLDRDCLWEIQTPQVFKKDLILEAYQRFGNTEVTDDAMLVEKMDFDVSVVPGSYSNIKITTFEDLVLAEAILKRQK